MTPDHVFQRLCCIVDELDVLAPGIGDDARYGVAVELLRDVARMVAERLPVEDSV